MARSVYVPVGAAMVALPAVTATPVKLPVAWVIV